MNVVGKVVTYLYKSQVFSNLESHETQQTKCKTTRWMNWMTMKSNDFDRWKEKKDDERQF
jgi:hypothetical protein